MTVSRVGRCKSASAADIQFCSRWPLRNCRHEHVPVISCSNNAASEGSQKLATRLLSANDADELLCRRHHQHNRDAETVNLATCCMLSRPLSSHIVVSPYHGECHCVACCSCSPFDRRSGNCPVFTFPVGTQSVRRAASLDSGLALCRSCSRQFSAAKDSSAVEQADLVQSSVESDAVIHKSSSVPACCSSQMRYYSAGISFDSLNDDTCRADNNGVDSTSSDSTAACNDAAKTSMVTESAESSGDVMPPTVMDGLSINSQVSPVEYHKRFEVHPTDILKCAFICNFQ